MTRSAERSVVLMLLASLAVLVAGLASPARAIVNGHSATTAQYPYMVSIQDTDGFAFCGGSVVAARWVLTAAHCVDGATAGSLRAVIGRTDLTTSAGSVHGVSEIHVHPQYDAAATSHDAALLRLTSPTSATAIALAGPGDDDLEAPGTPVTVAGWGDQLPTFGLFSSTTLRAVDLEVVDDPGCSSTTGLVLGFDAATGVCAQALLKDSCNGDSGGPLLAHKGGRPVQIGIVSYGLSCAVPAFPGVYSEVNNAEIRQFITTTAGV